LDSFEKQLRELLTNDSFVCWLQGKADEEEARRWNSWELEGWEKALLASAARKLIRIPFRREKRPDMQVELSRLQKAIARRELGRSGRLPDRNRGRGGRMGLFSILAIAAGLLLMVAAYWQYNFLGSGKAEPAYRELVTVYGKRATVTMADDSQIMLNAHSSLRYPEGQLGESKVEVWFRGEGYFNIKHNPEGRRRQFIVHTPDGDVTVLGTQFVVDTREHSTSVVLEKGSVNIAVKDTVSHREKIYVMKPGELTRFSARKDSISVAKVNTQVYSSWTRNRLYMDDTPLKDIKSRIEQTYGVDVVVRDKALLMQRVSGSLEDYNLEILLKGLSQVLGVNISRQDKLVVIGN